MMRQFKVLLLCTLLLCPILGYADVEIKLSPYQFKSQSTADKMEEIYAICDGTQVHPDSTITFIPAGCGAPILISMDAMRSTADPFDPTSPGMGEQVLLEAPYRVQLPTEGMYVIFCDDSFKTIATCLTVTSDLGLGGIDDVDMRAVPTLSEWSLIMLWLVLAIVAVRYYQMNYMIGINTHQHR